MAAPFWRLPRELWLQVFGFLCPAAGLSMRLVCRDFKELVDSVSLRTDWTEALRRADVFWDALRRWRVTSVLLSCSCSREEGLTTVVLQTPGAEETLPCFSHIHHLYLDQTKEMKFHLLMPLLPPRLRRLRLCEVSLDMFMNHNYESNVFIFERAPQLVHLRSLVCHSVFSANYEEFLPSLLLALPQLSHLSVTPPFRSGLAYRFKEKPTVRHRSLRSLELVRYAENLPEDVMSMVPGVRSLALIFSRHFKPDEDLPVRSWLRALPDLSSLAVVRGPSLSRYLELIPPKVTRLTLRPAHIQPDQLRALSAQLPELLHLHLEPSSSLGPDLALVPLLFPGLRSLRLRLQDVPEEALLGLAELKELQLLETQSFRPAPHKLVSRLRELTQGRVQVQPRPEPDQETCYCLQQLLRKDLQ